MHSRHVSHFRPQVLIILLVALGLLFAGVRVPDISRPHRPKPTYRVVLENHQKNVSVHLKHCGEFAAVLPKAPICLAPISLLDETQAAAPKYASSRYFSNSGRSPPAARS